LLKLDDWSTLTGIHRLELGLFAAVMAPADDEGDELWGGLSSLLHKKQWPYEPDSKL